MNIQTTEYLNDDYDSPDSHTLRRKGKRFQKKLVRSQTDAPRGKVTMFDPVAQLGIETEFNPTFSASKLERAWILEYLGPFYEDHYIADVLRQVKGGKRQRCIAVSRIRAWARRTSPPKCIAPKFFARSRTIPSTAKGG